MKNVGLKRIATTAVAALALSISGFTAAHATAQSRALPDGATMYALPCDNSVANGQLASVDVVSGAFTNIGTGTANEYAHDWNDPTGSCAGGATYNTVTKTAYWFNWRPEDAGLYSITFFSIDVTTGESTYIAQIKTPTPNIAGAGADSKIADAWGLTSDYSGNTYLLFSDHSDEHYWVGKVNLETGYLSNIQPLDTPTNNAFHGNYPYNFSFNPVNNTFYATTLNGPASVYSIDVTSGVTALVARTGSFSNRPCSITFDSNGVMWASNGIISSGTLPNWSNADDFEYTPGTTWYSEAIFIVSEPSTQPMLPDPVQQSSITSSSADTTTVGSIATVTVNGNFVEKVSAIQVNGVALPSSSWKQTATAVTITFTAKSAGKQAIQIFNGSAPALKEQTFTFVKPVVVAPATNKAKKETFIHCSKSGVGTRIVHGIDPVCPTGYHLGDI